MLSDLKRANDFFEETVEPKLLERRDIYLASKSFYAKKYPEISKKSDFRSFGFYAYVQWAKSPILDALFGTARVMHVVGCGPEDDASARVMEELIEWQISQQCAGYGVCEQWVEDALIYELGVLKLWWERSTGTKEFSGMFPEEQAQMIMSRPDVTVDDVGEPDYFGDIPLKFSQEYLISNKAVFDNISPFDMRWSPEAKSIESANFVAQRSRVTASDLRRGIDLFGYDASVVRDICENTGNITATSSESILNPELDNLGAEEDPARRQIEVYECYVNIDINDDGVLEPMIVTVAENKVIRVAENSFERTPFFTLSAHKDAAKVFSTDISMADIAGELQHLVVAMVRQLIINTSISNRPRKYIDMTRINVDDLDSDRMYIRCTGEPGSAVVNEAPTQIASWSMNIFELLKGYEEEWTGRTRYNQGMQADTLNKTATGITAIMRASSQRINMITKNFAESGFKPMLKFLVMLNQRFMDKEQMIRVFGKPLIVSPDDINGDMDILVETDVGLEKKQQRINALMQYLKEAYPFAELRGLAGPAQFMKATIEALELSGLSDASKYFMTGEEIAQNEREKQQLQLQQAALLGAANQRGGPGAPGVPVPGGNGAQAQTGRMGPAFGGQA